MSKTFDAIIIGGGIVGLALARAVLELRPGLKLLLLEKEGALAAHQTGHNSGVIHTGVYYKPGSLKAQFCVEGARAMLAYCCERGLPVEQPGKVIVAAREVEVPGLREVQRRGEANGVEGLRWLDASALREVEPHIRGVAALQVPTAAITDYAAVARSYAGEIQNAGGEIRLGAEVVGFQSRADGVVVATRHGDFGGAQVVNCAGLHADRLVALARGQRRMREMRVLPFRGEYYALAPEAAQLVRGLVYPVPDPRFPFLGVHFTPRIAGGVEAGPSAVLAWGREGYGRSSFLAGDACAMLGYRGFWAMAGRYWQKGLGEQYRSWSRAAYLRALQGLLPQLGEKDLLHGGSGVRAQIVLPDGRLMDDFCVLREERFLHVVNVPSPAATASLRIGRHLAERFMER